MINLTVNEENVPVSITKFPAGEIGVSFDVMSMKNVLQDCKVISLTINVQGYDSDTLFTILSLKEALDEFLKPYVTVPYFGLFLPYLPYSRYDRHMYRGDAFGLKVFAQVINAMNFNIICTLDVHSDVAGAAINNLYVTPQQEILMTHRLAEDYDAVVAPDAGAEKKALKSANALQCELVTLSKNRNVMTGEITGLSLSSGVVKGKKCLIVDDICDGGSTFIHAAKKLYDLGAERVDLYVTHGIFTKGVDVLRKAGIKNIYTTDSFEQSENDVNYVGYGNLL